jgi:hypothetical protein
MGRCSSNLSPLCCLKYTKGCGADYFGDPNHDPWNEVKGTGRDCGFSDVFKTLMVFANTFYGPFDSAGFHQKSIDSMKAYKARATSQCHLFQFFLPHIAKDMGQSHRLHEHGFAQEVWDGLGDGTDVMVMGPRLAMCRFHSTHAVMEHLKPLRSKRLLFWLYLGIQLGFVKSMKDCFFVEKLQVQLPSSDDTKVSMKEAQAKSISKMRGETKNTIHFAIRILLNDGWQRKSDTFYILS